MCEGIQSCDRWKDVFVSPARDSTGRGKTQGSDLCCCFHPQVPSGRAYVRGQEGGDGRRKILLGPPINLFLFFILSAESRPVATGGFAPL